MYIQTLEGENPFIVFSENVFDFERNFNIVFFDGKKWKAKRIFYEEAYELLKDVIIKKALIYRLKVKNFVFNPHASSYGKFIKINGVDELVYFDPIFAAKELERMKAYEADRNFRFKIEQVAIVSGNEGIEDYPEFEEKTSVELKSLEAMNQNDRIYAELFFLSSAQNALRNYPSVKSAKSQKEEDNITPKFKLLTKLENED